MKVVYVLSEGVLGVIVKEYSDEAMLVIYFIDGIRCSMTLEKEEYYILGEFNV